MITDITYINYCQQIAALFCENANVKPLCKANVKSRLVNKFTNQTFNDYFLPNLSTARFYLFRYLRKVSKNEAEFEIKDVVTGVVKTMILGAGQGLHFYMGRLLPQSIHNAMSQTLGYRIIDGGQYSANPFDLKDLKKPRLVMDSTPISSYGIIFVPSSLEPECDYGFKWNKTLGKCVPIYQPGGGGGGGGGEGGIIAPTPRPTSPIPELIAGFDFNSLLIPALVVGSVFVAYKFFK